MDPSLLLYSINSGIMPVAQNRRHRRGYETQPKGDPFSGSMRSLRKKEMLKNDRYTYRITWSEEDQEYAGVCVEFPSLSWLEENPEAALAGIRKMVADVVKDMKASNETPPEPLSSKRFSGKFMVRIPPELHRKLALEAQEEGISLNRLASDKLSRPCT